jgi:hypothetical protein
LEHSRSCRSLCFAFSVFHHLQREGSVACKWSRLKP